MIPIGGAQPEHNPDDSQHTGVPSPGNDQEEVKFLLPPNEIPERIINRIGQSEVVRSLFTRAILPVTRGFQLGEDCVTVFHTPEGIPEHVEIAHSHDVGGNLVSFLYRVKFIEDGRFHSPRAPNRSDWNVIEIPRDPNFLKSPRNLEELQFAFRRLFIGDPDLNPRFKESKIVQEPFQRIAVNALVSGAEARGSGMAVQPPGTGKTLVSWWTVDELFERAKSSDFLFSGKALYLVNNTVILREAREKLEQLFPGKYAITEVFDGNEDFSGEIILATPSSLANNRRIEELISSGTVHVIVHDETHHLPAETLSLLDRSLTQRMSAIGSRIHRIGVTATPARPDRLQVVGHYDDEIDFEFPITEAWRQGYAVHFKCFRGDKDINPDGISLIRPNSALDKKYRAERYGDHRFPNLANTYREVSKQDVLKKGLVLCPDVERASALANYFTAQGINAIRLAGIDRQKPNDWFEHHYFAWKNGCWPKDSPYSDQAVPEVVMAVDLLNEGTDVPGITTLMIWRDTESIIRLLQGWGRGMRPSPFKNHLNLVDCVGQFRRLHVISLLVAWSSHASTAKKPRDGSSEPVEKDTLRTESERPDNNPMFEADLEEVALAFLQDVALEYVRLYGTYAQIPQRAMERLDNFIVERCGLRSSTDLRELLSKAAEALVSSRDNLSMDTSLRSQFRSTLQPAFYSLGMYQSEDGEHIPRAATTMLIYSRIYNLMLEICPELNNEDMAKLFPEFHPGLDEFLSTRASNIRFLRTHVLGLGTEALERELIAAKGPDLDETSGATNNFFTLQAEDLETRDDRIDAVRFAEGRVRVRGYAMLSPGEVVLRDLQYFQRERIQDHVIERILQLERLVGKINFEDFQKPLEEFRDSLFQAGLITGGVQVQNSLLSLIQGRAETYFLALKQLGKNAQSDARDALVGLLLTPENRALLANSELGEAGQEIIGKIVGIIAEIQDHLVETKGSSDLELEEIIKDILETADRAYFGNVSSILPREVVLERRDARHFELMIPSSGILLERHGADRRPVSIVTDIFDQPYIFLGTTSSTDPLATCFRSANPSQRDSLLKGVTVALQKVADLQKSPPVLVLSAAKSDLDFLSALVDHVRKYTQFDFIGPVLADRYERGSAAGSFELSLETFRCSRLTRVSPDYAITLRGEGARTSTLAAKFAQFSAVQSRFNRGIADDLTALREYRLRQATKGPLQRAWDPVFEKLDALEEFQGYSVANVLQICSLGGLIGGLSEGRSLSNLVLAATYLATSGSLRTRADHSIIALVKNTELFVQRRGWRALEDQEDLRDDLEQLFTMVSTELLEKRAPTQIQRSSASDLVNRLRAGGWGPVREFE